MGKYKVTILTATYNRKDNLPVLYQSLCRQTSKDFQWLIIDDGSIDNTEEYVKSFIVGSDFTIEYHKKENGGKHTALNFSHPYIKGDLVFMVDSDDYLEDVAVKRIIDEWSQYQERSDIGVLSFRKRMKTGKMLSSEVAAPYIEDDITYRINHNVCGDRCEVIRSDLFVRYPLPEFKNEKFMGEGWLFRKIADQHKTVYLNDALYICDYLEDGLSKNGRLLRMKCPYGMMENCKSYFVPRVRNIIQAKQMVAFWVYGLCAGLSQKTILQKSERANKMILFYPFGVLLYLYWKKKYGFEEE